MTSNPIETAEEVLAYFRGEDGLLEYAQRISAARESGFCALVGFIGHPDVLPSVLLQQTREACTALMLDAGRAWSALQGEMVAMSIVEGEEAERMGLEFLQSAFDQTKHALSPDVAEELQTLIHDW